MSSLDLTTSVRSALKSRQRGFMLNPYRFGGGGGGGDDPYEDHVVLLLSGNDTVGSTRINDLSSKPKFHAALEAAGSATVSSAQTLFGAPSLLFNGGSLDYRHTDFLATSASQPLTAEAWVYPTAAPNGSCVISGAYPTAMPIGFALGFFGTSSAPAFGYYTGSAWVMAESSAGALTLNAWSHVAGVYTGTQLLLFVNGALVGSVSASNRPTATSAVVYVGRRWDLTSTPRFAGHLAEVRLTNGVARYTGAFSVPTALFPIPTYVGYGSDPWAPYMGGLLASAVAKTVVNDQPKSDPALTSNVDWDSNFGPAISSGLFKYKYMPSSAALTDAMGSWTLPFDVNHQLFINVQAMTVSADYATVTIEFLNASDAVFAALSAKEYSNYNMRLYYGPSLASLTYPGKYGSYSVVRGWLSFTSAGITYTDDNTTNYGNVTFGYAVDLSTVTQIRISSVRANSSYLSAGGGFSGATLRVVS